MPSILFFQKLFSPMPLSFAKKQTNVKNRIESVNNFLSHKRTSAQTTFREKYPLFCFFQKNNSRPYHCWWLLQSNEKKNTSKFANNFSSYKGTNKQTDRHTYITVLIRCIYRVAQKITAVFTTLPRVTKLFYWPNFFCKMKLKCIQFIWYNNAPNL